MLRLDARWLALALVVFLTPPMDAASRLPPVPELPSSGFPGGATAEPFARAVIKTVSPREIQEILTRQPAFIPPVLRNLGSALMTDDAELRSSLEEFLAGLSLTHARRVAESFGAGDLPLLVSMQLVDPIRFMSDGPFRDRVATLLPRTLDDSIPERMRTASLAELTENIEIDFDTAERAALAWGLVKRSSTSRLTPFVLSELTVNDDGSSRIAASIFSLNTAFFTPEETRRFLSALRSTAPDRQIIVLGDAPMRGATDGLKVDLIDTFGRAYTPWPRDPFTIGRTKAGPVFVNRPNLQPEREEDAGMVRSLVQALPDSGLWKNTRWTVAPAPFHNGHVLLTSEAAWISIHTVEIRALEILEIRRVPVETFGTKRGIERYLGAVRKAAAELEAVYGRPVRFVHPLDPDPALMRALGGGAGHDLDSLLTLLPQADGSIAAVVGDSRLGATLARNADWTKARAAYRISGDIVEAQSGMAMKSLQAFLDVISTSLAAGGMAVRRLPLIRIPAQYVPDASKDFLMTWNNVVLEPEHAEGFASLLEEGDDHARKVFADLGYRLDLFPPLVRSIVLSGGYRCASNHLR